MAISRGRNELQAHIDETAIVFERLLDEVPKHIEVAFKKLHSEIIEQSGQLDSEESWSLYSNLFNTHRLDDESFMIEIFYKSIIIMLCSYCETTLSSLVSKKTLIRIVKTAKEIKKQVGTRKS